MTTHPILGPIASVHALGVATLEAIKANSGCSIPTMLAEINAWALEVQEQPNKAYDDWNAGWNAAIAASLAAPPAQGELVLVPRAKLEQVATTLGRVLGDTDPYFADDTTDDDVRDEAPVFWACQQINTILTEAPQSAPAPVQVDEDCGCYTETTWADGFEAIEEVSCAKHAQPPAPGEAVLPPHAPLSGDSLGVVKHNAFNDGYRAGYNAAIAALAQQRVHVSDEMVERACKKYAFREDGALFPDDYSPHEVAAERVLMREFLTHVIDQHQEARGNGE